MRVTNSTRGTVLAEHAQEATRPLERMKGLLGRSDLPLGQALHIVPCNSIHTFFMKMAIDVAFLDRDGRVLQMFHALPPWRTTRIYFGARSVLELPPGVLAATGTQAGDTLHFERGS